MTLSNHRLDRVVYDRSTGEGGGDRNRTGVVLVCLELRRDPPDARPRWEESVSEIG